LLTQQSCLKVLSKRQNVKGDDIAFQGCDALEATNLDGFVINIIFIPIKLGWEWIEVPMPV